MTLEIIQPLIYRIERDLYLAAKNRARAFSFNYPQIKIDPDLYRYLRILRRMERDIINNVTPCLTDILFENLKSNVLSLTNPAAIYCDATVVIDDTDKRAWELSHPYCISRTRWEELAYYICTDLSFELTTTEEKCLLIFDITTNQISCDTVAALSLYTKLCNLGYKVVRTDGECRLDHSLLLADANPNCHITYGLYKKLIECGLSYDIIKLLLCDNVGVSVRNGKVVIKTSTGEYK